MRKEIPSHQNRTVLEAMVVIPRSQETTRSTQIRVQVRDSTSRTPQIAQHGDFHLPVAGTI
jgi:hypothetical protein